MTSTTLHDIYDPPPAPVPLAPPAPEPMNWTSSDLGILAGLVTVVVGLAAWAWTIEPAMAFLVMIGGAIVIVESWSTALGFLQRRPWMGMNGRWKIFVAALVPWLVGLGLAAALMMGLFLLSDWFA
jgi:hypothetical protein